MDDLPPVRGLTVKKNFPRRRRKERAREEKNVYERRLQMGDFMK